MYRQFGLLFISIATLTAISCKEKGKSEAVQKQSTEASVDVPNVEKVEKRQLTPAEIEKANSVMSRLIVIPESKKTARYIVTANMADLLSNENGPFLIFAPSDRAIESLPLEQLKFYSDQQNLSKLQDILKSHIVKSDLNNDTLLKLIKKDGKVKLKTLDGENLIISEADGKMIIADEKGGSAIIVKSDVQASNGQVFIIDRILNLP